MNHASRSHSRWAASATARNWACPGAIAMATISPAERKSPHAARGTAAHEVAERCLLHDLDASSQLGETIKVDGFSIDVDEEMANNVQVYLDYVRERAVELQVSRTIIEERFDLDRLRPPFEAGGTCDAILISVVRRTLEVIDLKYGVGVVEAVDNKQLRTYALGALLEHKDSGVETVIATIVQPRARHVDGVVRSESFHVADLLTWGINLLKAMERSKEALDAFERCGGNRVAFDDWAASYLSPGDTCRFCPAEGVCPARRKDVLRITPQVLRNFLDDPSLETPPTNMPVPTGVEELARTLDALDNLEEWINAVRHHAQMLAEAGTAIPNWGLTDKIGLRAWLEEDEAISGLLAAGLSVDQLYTKKLISPAQADKLLGKRKGEIADLYERPIRGKNLVRLDRTSRTVIDADKTKSFVEVGNGKA